MTYNYFSFLDQFQNNAYLKDKELCSILIFIDFNEENRFLFNMPNYSYLNVGQRCLTFKITFHLKLYLSGVVSQAT